ncbi:hypothetical protein LTR15_012834 [Elasticomyces elasticus]|nr:hypothetical protein LTR15_012834 [Elasticomyces elasticus]
MVQPLAIQLSELCEEVHAEAKHSLTIDEQKRDAATLSTINGLGQHLLKGHFNHQTVLVYNLSNKWAGTCLRYAAQLAKVKNQRLDLLCNALSYPDLHRAFSLDSATHPTSRAIYATVDDQRMIAAGMERAVREIVERLSTELGIAVNLE